MKRHPAAIVLDALNAGLYIILDDTAYAMEEMGRQLCYMHVEPDATIRADWCPSSMRVSTFLALCQELSDTDLAAIEQRIMTTGSADVCTELTPTTPGTHD